MFMKLWERPLAAFREDPIQTLNLFDGAKKIPIISEMPKFPYETS